MQHKIFIFFISVFFLITCEHYDLKKDVGDRPTVTTTPVTAITGNSAVSGGEVRSEGGASVAARGICWDTLSNPTISNFIATEGGGKGSFTATMTSLKMNMKYYIRAYATNRYGTDYGEEFSFTTTSGPGIAALTTMTVSAITDSSAMSGGFIISDGGSPVIARGVCWSTTPTPTILNSKTNDSIGSGSFISVIKGLLPKTYYYVRAYANNIAGTAYGNQVLFKTNSQPGLIPTDSLTFFFPFNGNVLDSSGYGNHGTLYGGVSWTTDRFGRENQAIQFNGSNAYVLVPNSAHYPSAAITIAYWFNRNGVNPTNLESYLSKELSFQSYLQNVDRKLYSGLYMGTPTYWKNYSSSPFIVPSGSANWIFYAFTYSNTEKKACVYMNGLLMSCVQEADPAVLVRLSTNKMYIGRSGYSSTYFLNGKMDDLRIYTRTLDSLEIKTLYHEGGWE